MLFIFPLSHYFSEREGKKKKQTQQKIHKSRSFSLYGSDIRYYENSFFQNTLKGRTFKRDKFSRLGADKGSHAQLFLSGLLAFDKMIKHGCIVFIVNSHNYFHYLKILKNLHIKSKISRNRVKLNALWMLQYKTPNSRFHY